MTEAGRPGGNSAAISRVNHTGTPREILSMPGRRDEITKQWIFDSVQEFWSSKVAGRYPASVQHGNFVGQVVKGIVDEGRLRELRRRKI